ncbi:MAG TPA: hypothetical protein VK717_07785 [Opitutaceae bacterium]|jgi:hypothetical protein|nr:hypothetical protein [Opitutaceae bacterium]
MINSSANSAPAREIPIADLHKTFDAQISTLDPQRAQDVADLGTVRSAKAATLAHEQNLLTRKLGANDPRIAALVQQQARNAALQTVLTAEVTRAQTPAPAVSAQSYIFHGYVFDAQNQPLPKLSVALYDDEGNWFSELGYGCTDEKGYFLMRYDRAQKPKPAPAPQPAPTPAPPAPAPAPSPITGKLFGTSEADVTNVVTPIDIVVKRSGDTTGRFDVNIRVFDQQQKLLYCDPKPLQPQLGQVDYRVIIIGADAATCTPPPDTSSPGTTEKNPGTYTPARDIASLRKQPAAPQSKVAAKAAVPVKAASSAAAKKKSAPAKSRAAAPAKIAGAKRPVKKSPAAKRKPPSRKKKKSK